MSFSSLNQFVRELESKGELIRVHSFVSPRLEISEITDRISKSGGKALLFENNGSSFPLLINAMGSERRICMALGVESLDDIGKSMMDIFKDLTVPRESLMSKLSMLPKLAGIAGWMPKSRKGRGECQEVILENPDLSVLPVLTCWPFDGGPFITLPVVHTAHPETGLRNVGMYRMQVFSKTETGMHWHLHKNSAAHYREYKRLGQRMPVVVTLGGDPVYTYAATAPLPENVDEYLLAGFLRKKSVDLVKAITCNIEVPADADFVLEGYVDPMEELAYEGPFGDHTGFYSLADYYPRFHVTCITHRRNAIYPTTIVGIPPQEDAWIGKATERIFLTPIRLSMLPEIEDMHMPMEGVFHNLVIARIKKTFPGQAMKVMNSLWGAGQMMFNKVLIVVDGQVEVTDYPAIMRAILEHTDLDQDLYLTRGPVDVLDHSSSRFAVGSKLGIDATVKLDGERRRTRDTVSEPKPEHNEPIEGISLDRQLQEKGYGILLVYLEKTEKGQVRELHQLLGEQGRLHRVDWVIYLDGEMNGLGMNDITWIVANNIDPLRDCFSYDHESGKKIMAIDGTKKTYLLDSFERDWPNVLTMDEEVIREIDQKWETLGLGPFIPSPSLRYRKLVKVAGAVASAASER